MSDGVGEYGGDSSSLVMLLSSSSVCGTYSSSSSTGTKGGGGMEGMRTGIFDGWVDGPGVSVGDIDGGGADVEG